MSVAWLLNLEADLELQRPTYQPSPAVERRLGTLRSQVLELVRPGDVVVEPGVRADGRAGVSWCPTPQALARLRRAGAEPIPSPGFEVLQRVNHRRFCADLGQTLPGGRWCTSLGEVEGQLESGVATTGVWLLKRPFSFSGSARRRVTLSRGGLDDDLRRWVTASLREDGLQVEPWMRRSLDVVLHGWVGTEVRLGAICTQVCDARGAWQTTRLGAELSSEEARALGVEAERAARALEEAGYWGPFAVDGFRYEGGFCSRVEINARYTMGWAVGLPLRPDMAMVGS